MSEVLVCNFCGRDPFEYVEVDTGKVAVAISCCEDAVNQYYQGLTTMSSSNGGDLLKLDNPQDS